MAKVVITANNPITLIGNSFLILDHETINNQIYYKYRVNFKINDQVVALRDSFEIRITRQSPFSNRPNMFKNESIASTSDFMSKIKNYDKKRLEVFKKKVDIVKKIPLLFQDLKNGFVEFTLKDPGTQIYYATLTKTNDLVAQNQQMVNIDNDSLISKYALPDSNFVLGASRVFKNKIRIAITPNDKRIAKFKISVYDSYNNRSIDERKCQRFSVTVASDRTSFIDIPDSGSIKRKIRVTAVSYFRSLENNLYKEIEINSDKKYGDKCIIYPIKFDGKSVRFAIRSIPNDVIYVKLLRKDLARPEREAAVVASAPVDTSILTLEDREVRQYHTHLYYAQFEFKDGTERNSSAFYVLSPKILKTDVRLLVKDEGFNTTLNNVTRKFNVSINYNDKTSTQNLIDDLKNLGVDNIFPNEIKNLSTQLDPLIGILVSRIDSINCSEQRLGVFKPGEITDTFVKSAQCVYIFEVVIKSPVEAIEDIASSRDYSTADGEFNVGDPMIASRALGLSTFQKRVNFTQKFFNRSALYFGTLNYGKSLSTLNAGIESGRTSIFKSLLFQPQQEKPTIRGIVSSLREDDKILTWTSIDNADVDNFTIIDVSSDESVNLGSVIADSEQTSYVSLVPKNVTRVKIQANMVSGEGIALEADI